MKRLLIAFLLSAAASSAVAEELRISDLSGGMWSAYPSNKIPENAASFLENVFTDTGGVFEPRFGFDTDIDDTCAFTADGTAGASTTVSGLFGYTSPLGVDFIIVVSSGRAEYINRSSQYGGCVAQAVSAVSFQWGNHFGSTVTVRAAQNLGKLFVTNRYNTPGYFSGTFGTISFTEISTMPKGGLIAPWRNRIVVANSTSGISTAYFSADGDGTNWILGGNPTDPFNLTIGGTSDGNELRCLQNYGDDLIFGKNNELWKLSGFDQADVVVRRISSDYGCVDQGSMQEKEGALLFMSNVGIVELRGETVRVISDPIRDIVDSVLKNNVQTSTPVPMASAVYEGRYWLMVSTSQFNLINGNFANDRILVFQRNGSWTTLKLSTGVVNNSTIHGGFSGGMLVWKDLYLYIGIAYNNSRPKVVGYGTASNNEMTEDLDTPVRLSAVTRSYDLGAPMRRKEFRDLWLVSEGNADWSDASPYWTAYFDCNKPNTPVVDVAFTGMGSSSYLISDNTFVDKFPFSLDGVAESCYNIRFKIVKNYLDSEDNIQLPRLYDMALRYSIKEFE